MITIKKGLDLPITGEPSREISEHRPAHVALIGYDYVGMKPTMNVKEGDIVAKGQPVFEDKKRVGVIYTAPAAGKVIAIKRGERRVFESLVIAVDPNGEEIDFQRYDSQQLADLDSEIVETLLVFRLDFIPYAILLGVVHILIDLLKLYSQSNESKRIWFLIDQFLHIISIFFIIMLYNNLLIENYSLVPQFWPIATAVLFLSIPASITIKNLISIWTPNTNDTKQDLENAGSYIGILERLFIFLFILIGQFSAIGFLLAAKSIFRFGDLTKSKDRKLTEYVLIGTLLSFGVAIVVGLLTQYVLGFLR